MFVRMCLYVCALVCLLIRSPAHTKWDPYYRITHVATGKPAVDFLLGLWDGALGRTTEIRMAPYRAKCWYP